MVKFTVTNIAIFKKRVELFFLLFIDTEEKLCLRLLRVVIATVDKRADVKLALYPFRVL